MLNKKQARFALFTVLSVSISLVALPLAEAQNGHPLVGSWSGDWGPDATQRNRLLLTLDFSVDQVISGYIFESGVRIPLATAALNPNNWSVHMTAQHTDANGNVINYVIEGVVENLGSVTERAITGIWSKADVRGDFRVTIN